MQATPLHERSKPLQRAAFRHFIAVGTRWHDNDVFGHVNNVVYYSYFDTAVNRHLMDNSLLNLKTSPIVGLVAETSCTYFESVAFPDQLAVGMAVTKIGKSSVTYCLGLFKTGSDTSVAICTYTHVYVERASNKPIAIPEAHQLLFESIRI